ncbi:MAG: ABC transporter permease, partial [Alsobacter sp.]
MDQADLEERPFRQFVRDFTRSTDAVVALVVLLGVLTAAALAPVLSPQNPYDLTQIDILDNLQKPGSESMSGM